MARSTKSSDTRESAAGRGGTTATQLLRKDHKTVQQLFDRFEKAGDRAHETKQRLFSEIESELETHATIEEEIFYPAVQEEVSDSKDIVAEAIEEHNVVKSLLREIGAMSSEDEQYDAKVKVLQENVEHHIEEEEGEMFPKVERELGAERLQELGTEMEARKEALGQPALQRIVSGVTGLIFGNGESKASGSDSEEGEERGSHASQASSRGRGQAQRRGGESQGRGSAGQRRSGESPRAGRSTQRKSEGTGRSQRGSQGSGRSTQPKSEGGGRRSAAKATTGRSRNAKKASGRSEARKRATATAKKRGSGRSAAAKATANRRSSKKRGGGTAASAKRRTSTRKSARKR